MVVGVGVGDVPLRALVEVVLGALGAGLAPLTVTALLLEDEEVGSAPTPLDCSLCWPDVLLCNFELW